jgi:CTP-dependent riboflavin kinase
MTPVLIEVLRAVKDLTDKRPYSPTIKEVGEHSGRSSKAAYEAIRRLEDKGLIERKVYKNRSIKLTEAGRDSLELLLIEGEEEE